MFHDLYATEVKHYYQTYVHVDIDRDISRLKVTTARMDLSDLERAGKDVNKWKHANIEILMWHLCHGIAVTMSPFDIPVTTSSPGVDVTLTSPSAGVVTTAPETLTTSKGDTTPGVTTTVTTTPSKKYFFKVVFSMLIWYTTTLSSYLCQCGTEWLSV